MRRGGSSGRPVRRDRQGISPVRLSGHAGRPLLMSQWKEDTILASGNMSRRLISSAPRLKRVSLRHAWRQQQNHS